MRPEDNPDDDDLCLCGLCGLPGADKMACWTGGGVYWPGEQRSATELVHSECEQAERKRAHAALSPAQREQVLRGLTLHSCPQA